MYKHIKKTKLYRFIREKKYKEAIDCIDKIIKKNPDKLPLHITKAAIYHFAGENEKALKICNEVLKINSDCYDALSFKALILYYIGKDKEADKCTNKILKMIDRAISNEPTVELFRAKIFHLIQASRYQDALDCFKKAIECEPENPNLWFGKAEMELYLNKIKDAIYSFSNFLNYRGHGNFSREKIRYAKEKIKELKEMME
jgi:tetratricopeptide (TPR) repeat protein